MKISAQPRTHASKKSLPSLRHSFLPEVKFRSLAQFYSIKISLMSRHMRAMPGREEGPDSLTVKSDHRTASAFPAPPSHIIDLN